MIGGIVGISVGGVVGMSVGIGVMVGSGVSDTSGVTLGETLGDSDRLGDGEGRPRHESVGANGAPHDLPYGVKPSVRNR